MAKRIKNRYVLAETSASADMSSAANQKALESRLINTLGTLGYSYANPKILPVSDRQFILRVQRNTEEHMIIALSFIKEINGTRTGIYTIKTSGTIKSLRQSFIKQIAE